MKKMLLLLSAPTITTTAVKAQKEVDASYRRSSVCLMLVNESSMPKRDVIKNAFYLRNVPKIQRPGYCTT